MFTDVALMAGATIGLYGLLGLIQQQKCACLHFVISWNHRHHVVKRRFHPGVLWICLFLSPIFLAQCRTKQFWLHSLTAGLIALIAILPWPIQLYLQHPDLFIVWFWKIISAVSLVFLLRN